MSRVSPGVPLSPNPMFLKASNLFQNRHEFRKVAQGIKDRARCFKSGGKFNNDVDIGSLVNSGALDDLKEQFMGLMQGYLDTPLAKGTIPPPPKPNALYGRIADGVSIVDVGSGAGNRLNRQKDRLDIVAVDKVVEGVNLGVRREQEDIKDRPVDDVDVLTSFNVITQLDPEGLERVEKNDGIHVFPDVEVLINQNVAVRREDGLFESVATNGAVYLDRLYQLGALKIHYGYLGYNCYSEATIRITVNAACLDPVVGEEPNFMTAEGSRTLVCEDYGHKYDGEPVMFDIEGVGGRLVERDGSSVPIETSFGDFDLQLHCERVVHRGRVRYVLFRIPFYRGYIPFHSGPMLRKFCERKRIIIDGQPLIPPFPGDVEPLVDGLELPTDGVILRENEQDYRLKTVNTVDVYDPGGLKNYLLRKGWMCDFIDPRQNVLAEYSLDYICNGRVKFTFVKLRPDKKRPDDNDLIFFRLEHLY